jgi:two-component system, OmpR family, sensor histidine kinase KdpD
MRKTYKIWHFFTRTIPGCLLVGLITFICFRLQLNLSVTGFVYLIAVVLQSLMGNFASSVVVSLVAVLCLDFFFVPPRFSFEVTNPLDILALVAFLTTGLVITRLNTRVRQEAGISDHQRHQMHRLYQLAQGLLALDPEDRAHEKLIELFRDLFELRGVCLFDGDRSEIHCTGCARHGFAEQTQAAFSSGIESDDTSTEILIRCLRVGSTKIGAIAFEGLQNPKLTVGPLCALAAVMLERANTFRTASHAAAAAQTELFRGAVLDALAHEFKTPLATILTAAGGLREVGPLCSAQSELAEIIETEAARLGDLTSRVLGTNRLDKEQVKPQLDRTNMTDLVVNLVAQYARQSSDRTFLVANETTATEIFADSDLLQLALRQLLDNACKYSPPGSAVKVSLELQNEQAAVRVSNSGNLIRSNERTRIFERFYRGAEARHMAPGSGLGLYFANQIIQAHGGSIELEDETARASENTVLRLTLPLVKSAG